MLSIRPAMPSPVVPGARQDRLFRRLRVSRDGATAIEMAFLLPVFLLFLLGIVEFGRAMWTQTALQYAVEKAARLCAVAPSECGTNAEVRAYAASQVFGLSIPPATFTYTPNAVCGAASASSGAQVTASYAFQAIVPQLIPVNITLGAKSCHP
jgi:Flp pilus assembly protein TadG